MRIDRRNSGAQCFVARDEDDVGIVSRERFDVVNGSERAAQRVIFDEAGGKEFVRGAKNISERNTCRFFSHSDWNAAETAAATALRLRVNLSALLNKLAGLLFHAGA